LAHGLIDKKDEIKIDKNSIRAALIPFEIENENDFSISTITETIYLFKK
jgi:hypothetical protein